MIHFWRQGMFESLREAAIAAEKIPEWSGYASYCQLRERGLRQESLDRLDAFIAGLVHEGFDHRLAFIRWIMPRAEGTSNGMLLIPQPLYDRLIGPTLREWAGCEPREAEPRYWLGLREHRREDLRRAIELDPGLDEAKVRLAGYILGDIEHAERSGRLPEGRNELDAAIREVRGLIEGLPKSQVKQDLSEEVEGYCKRLLSEP